jgi:hypothetical protein
METFARVPVFEKSGGKGCVAEVCFAGGGTCRANLGGTGRTSPSLAQRCA